jgi:hypothetical protein
MIPATKLLRMGIIWRLGTFNCLFRDKHLLLDETLVCAFGQIKFKVRIVTKAARYGINIYVIADATAAFVLWVLIYTGKTTFYANSKSIHHWNNACQLDTTEGIRLAKSSTGFKQLKRGDALKCKVCFRTESSEASEAGLVCWHDWNMVYCLSDDSNT